MSIQLLLFLIIKEIQIIVIEGIQMNKVTLMNPQRSSKTFHVSIFKSIINGIERYHILINDSSNKITTTHPIIVKRSSDSSGKYKYEKY